MVEAGSGKNAGWLSELVRTHGSMLLRFFSRNAPDQSEAHDLVQDVFLKLSASNIPITLEHPSSYVMTVARSVLVDNSRRRRVRYIANHSHLGDDDLEARDLPMERVLDSKAMAQRMQEALLQLPERTRDVFALRTLRGMKMAEVARTLEISLSSAEKHHARALSHLAARLADFR